MEKRLFNKKLLDTEEKFVITHADTQIPHNYDILLKNTNSMKSYQVNYGELI